MKKSRKDYEWICKTLLDGEGKKQGLSYVRISDDEDYKKLNIEPGCSLEMI